MPVTHTNQATEAEELAMPKDESHCSCCELAVDLTLAAWESWCGNLAPDATAEEAAEQIAAMYARIYPTVARHCTCGREEGGE